MDDIVIADSCQETKVRKVIEGRGQQRDVTSDLHLFSTDCDRQVCVLKDTTHEKTVENVISKLGLTRSNNVVYASTLEYFYQKFKDGSCNVLAGDEFDLSKEVLNEKEVDAVLWDEEETMSREFFSIVTRDGDAKFSDFVNYMLQSLMTADEERKRQGSAIKASDLDETEVFGSRYRTMFQDAFEVVEGYVELYERHLVVPRSRANTINGNEPAMHYKPLGNLRVDNPPELKSPTIDEIKNRKLRVGVDPHLPVFSVLLGNGSWFGIDIDFAKALSAALFDGDPGNVVFVNVTSSNRFEKLKNGEIDVLAGTTTITMERDLKENTAEQGFSFSTPMLHDQMKFVGKNKS